MTTQVLSGWGAASESLAQVIRATRDGPLTVPPGSRGALARGMARSYGDAAQNAGGVVIDMTTRTGLHALDETSGRVTVGAGTTLDELLRATVPLGWFLPVTPGTRQVTVGGSIAADVHGKNHLDAGSFRHHLHGFTLQLADGRLVWVTPSDGEVFPATLGGMGLTGVILDAELGLQPVQSAWMRTRTVACRDLDECLDTLDTSDAPYRVAWLDLLSRGRRLGRGIVSTGEHAVRDDLPPARRADPLAYTPGMRGEVPPWVPTGLLNRATAAAFNTLWFARAPRAERISLEPLATFFYPLDAVGHWNRLYGRRGFVQYQFVVPLDQADVVRRIIARLAGRRCPTFLAVLKRLGPGAGLLSFPAEGWTLAADIPAGVAGLGPLLESCDDLVCEAGGRVYLAKDGRLRPERLPVMYPELDRWREIRARLDPQHRWRSDLGRRLGLCTA